MVNTFCYMCFVNNFYLLLLLIDECKERHFVVPLSLPILSLSGCLKDILFPPSDEGGGKIEDFDGGRDKVLNGSYLSLSLANARQLPRQREQKNKHIKQLDKPQLVELFLIPIFFSNLMLTSSLYCAKILYNQQTEVIFMKTLNFAAEYFYFSFYFTKSKACFTAEK